MAWSTPFKNPITVRDLALIVLALKQGKVKK
jgi:hypothetical protein